MGMQSWYRQFFPRQSGHSTLKATREAAEGGDVEAQFALGLKYCTDPGAGQDLPQAAGWYQRAAEQGHALAQLNLGRMFANGDGVPKDDATALDWMRRSAESGDAGAQYVLGSKYRRFSLDRARTDCAASRVEAYLWLHLAAEQGYMGAASACEQVNLSMSRQEVSDGNQRVAEFTVRKPELQPVG